MATWKLNGSWAYWPADGFKGARSSSDTNTNTNTIQYKYKTGGFEWCKHKYRTIRRIQIQKNSVARKLFGRWMVSEVRPALLHWLVDDPFICEGGSTDKKICPPSPQKEIFEENTACKAFLHAHIEICVNLAHHKLLLGALGSLAGNKFWVETGGRQWWHNS